MTALGTRFPSARAKTARVKDDLHTMTLDARRFLSLHQDAVSIQLHPDRTRYIFRIEELYDPPEHWLVTIGEILFNLRSALDHVAYALAVEHSGPHLDPELARTSEFPIFTDPDEFGRQRERKIGGIAPDKQTLIERLQPYSGRDRANATTDIDEVPEWLQLLHELNRVEKHRLPPILTQLLDMGSWDSAMPRLTHHFGPLERGAVIAEMPFHPDFHPEVSVQPQFSFTPALLHEGNLINLPGTLSVLHLAVDRVIDFLDDRRFYRTRREELLRVRAVRPD